MSARLDRSAEDVSIHAIVVVVLELVDVQMQILLADFVERAHDPAFHDRPKAFDGVRVNGSANIFPTSMMDHAMRDLLVQNR